MDRDHNNLTDGDLIAAIVRGEASAFRRLVEQHEAQVAATVIGMLGKCPEAEDVGLETFVRFYQAIDSFKGNADIPYANRDKFIAE
jgi:RNA polymerase sigma-70 factor, ECF subfamily